MIAVSTKVDVTGPDVAGSEGVLVMVTLSSLPVRVFPCCVQEMEVRGRLKPEMMTDRLRSSPAKTSIEAIWPGASPTVGGSGGGGGGGGGGGREGGP